MGAAWTAQRPLPGGALDGSFDAFVARLVTQHPGFDAHLLRRLARRHGALVEEVIDGARSSRDLGADLGMGLSEREVVYMRDHEWARTAEDVLWRRTKAGLHLSATERDRAAQRIEMLLRT
jgi:glycerol-3-phosphate dehydrogenase